MQQLRPRLVPAPYPEGTVCSVYFDTPSFLLVRLSLEHPVYKEKFRLRWYGEEPSDENVFPEIKKKFRGIVYKRRIACTAEEARQLLSFNTLPERKQDASLEEMRYLFCRYPLSPAVLVAYEREAWRCLSDPDIRITFDRNIRARSSELQRAGSDGAPLLPDGEVLMEIKFPGASPLWLARLLSGLEIFPVSFSKYGTWYTDQCKRKKEKTCSPV